MTIDVRTTRIYKRLLPCIRKQDRKEFTRMFQRAADYGPAAFYPNARSLMYAFWWRNTPQGEAYWAKLHTRLRDGGYSEIAG